MDELIAFLNARLDERAQLAEMISGGGYAADVWEVDRSSVGSWSFIWAKSRTNIEPREAAVREDDNPVAIVQHGRNEDMLIAANDPDWILADVAAKRRILARVLDDAAIDMPPAKAQGVSREEWYVIVTARDVIKLLALPYADHPDYDEFHWGLQG